LTPSSLSSPIMLRPRATLFPYTTLFRSDGLTYDFKQYDAIYGSVVLGEGNGVLYAFSPVLDVRLKGDISKVYDGTNRASVSVDKDRKSTRLNSSHVKISYAVFCLKKKKQ